MPRRVGTPTPFALAVLRGVLGPSAAVVAVVGLGLGFLPLFAGPGYESALGLGLVLPWCTAASTASRARHVEGVFARVLVGLSRGALLAGIAWATTVLHGLRAGFCGFLSGSALFALGPFVGALVAGAFAGVAAHVALSRRPSLALAVLAAFVGPLGGIAVSALRFLGSPVVFAFDPFVGFFSGMLYDTVVDGIGLLATYRAGSAATLVATLLAALAWDRRSARLGLVAAPFAVASALHAAYAPALGHAGTPDSIARALGGSVEGQHCRVVHARTLRPRDVALFVRDCDADVVAVSAWLGVAPPRITAYLFASADEKRRLMGAAEVYVAKPWRREVYVQASGYPHPVLRHEVAHVVAGEVARGPFRVAGALFGLVPNPGLVEGLAVAAAPEDDELSPAEWSAAMVRLGLLPRARSLFSLGFLGHDAARAYTVAGAFVGFVRDTHGAEAVRRWYGGASIEEATGKSLDALDDAFRAHVAALPLPDAALPLAKARFDRPAVFARRCPHEVDLHRKLAQTKQLQGDDVGARAEVDAALTLAPRDGGLLLLRAGCAERIGEPDARERLLALAADPTTSLAVRLRADERLADRDLAEGRVEEAEARLATLRARVLDEDHGRSLDVKLAAARRPALRPAVVALLVGPADRGPDTATGMELLGRIAADEPVAVFLLAKNAAARGDHARVVALLDEASSSVADDVPASILREAARLRVVAGCALRDRARVDRGLAALRAAPPSIGNRRALVEELAASCTR